MQPLTELGKYMKKKNETDQRTQHASPQWMDCGEGILIHPTAHEPICTRVVELKGHGRIFEVYDYSNEPEQNFRMILASPELLDALKMLVNVCTHPQSTKDEMRLIAREAQDAISKAQGNH